MKTSPLMKYPHGFFPRRGGVSSPPFDSLNFGLSSGDDPKNVQKNRKIALKALGAEDSTLLCLRQVHGNQVVLAEHAWPSASDYLLMKKPTDQLPQGDALVTTKPGLVLGIITADCVPILFEDAEMGIIGAAHAGWRGTLSGIIENTLQVMEDQGACRNKIKAAIGPCIHQNSFEVGKEVKKAFEDSCPGASHFFKVSVNPGYFLFDLVGFVQQTLRNEGVRHIYVIPENTYTQEKNYFSYRRSTHTGEPGYGCQLSAIYLP